MRERADVFAYKVYIVYSLSSNIYELNSPLRYNGINPD